MSKNEDKAPKKHIMRNKTEKKSAGAPKKLETRSKSIRIKVNQTEWDILNNAGYTRTHKLREYLLKQTAKKSNSSKTL
jgi:hypothetical protein